MVTAVKLQNLSKQYRLGLTHAGSVRELINGAIGRLWKRKPRGRSAATSSRIDGDGNFWAIKDISFEIPPGEVVGIIGRNGAGKSTLLKILSRITTPSTGRVEMRGRVASLLEVGTGFHPELTGRENVYMNGTILGMTRREISQHLEAIVDFAGIEPFIDTPVKRYSSGMAVRLGFAVAAHLEPEILIVDEVLAVGDAEFQKKCLGKLDDVARSGRTVLFVSHNMAAVRQLTARCAVIEDGRLAFFGKTEPALDLYLRASESRISSSKSIADLPRSSWCGDQSVQFVTAENLTPVCEEMSDISLNLGIKATVEMDFRIGITLHGPDGQPVAAGFGPKWRSQTLDSEQEFGVQISNPGLAPGKYWFTIGIIRGTRELIDVVDEVLHFEVPNKELPEGIREWNTAWGQVQLNMTVSKQS